MHYYQFVMVKIADIHRKSWGSISFTFLPRMQSWKCTLAQYTKKPQHVFLVKHATNASKRKKCNIRKAILPFSLAVFAMWKWYHLQRKNASNVGSIAYWNTLGPILCGPLCIQHIQHSPIFSQVMNGHFTNVYQSINTQQKRSRLKRSSLIACFAYIIFIPA